MPTLWIYACSRSWMMKSCNLSIVSAIQILNHDKSWMIMKTSSSMMKWWWSISAFYIHQVRRIGWEKFVFVFVEHKIQIQSALLIDLYWSHGFGDHGRLWYSLCSTSVSKKKKKRRVYTNTQTHEHYLFGMVVCDHTRSRSLMPKRSSSVVSYVCQRQVTVYVLLPFLIPHSFTLTNIYNLHSLRHMQSRFNQTMYTLTQTKCEITLFCGELRQKISQYDINNGRMVYDSVEKYY